MFSPVTLLLITACYLTILFTLGTAAEKGWLPAHWGKHPLTYSLSLGGYVGAWAIFGALELANNEGYTFLAYYFGTSVLFIFSPLLLRPMINLSRTYRLSSLADLFSFRYCSKNAGALVTAGTLISVLPLIALQINAITESAEFLIRQNNSHTDFTRVLTPILFCITIGFLCIRLSSQRSSKNKHHDGLIITTAFQSLIKLAIFLLIGIVSMQFMFGSPAEMESWLSKNPEKLNLLHESLQNNNVRTLMLIFFAAALSFPHMYHLAINENRNAHSLRVASWVYPLYLLLLSLPILPILWAAQSINAQYPAFLLALAIGEMSSTPSLTLLAYICCLAAAISSAVIMIISIASMCMNHFVLPYYSPHKRHNLYQWLYRTKIISMMTLIILAYICYIFLRWFNCFTLFSFASYTAAFQFLPGILACFYWPRANRRGLIAGLIVGFSSWLIFIILPNFTANTFGLNPLLEELFNLSGNNYWIIATIACLGFNMSALGVFSLLTSTDEEQRNAAELCSQDNLSKPNLQQLNIHHVSDFISLLSKPLGNDIAKREISNALSELNMQHNETRPFALRLLRRQIESNLSGLFGPTTAREMVAKYLPYQTSSLPTATKDIQLIEHRLENFPSELTGLAAELDNLRRYHRNTLEQLPIGVCTYNTDNEILMWNDAMCLLTHISSTQALGTSIHHLPSPWNELLHDFTISTDTEWHNHAQIMNNETRWFTLHKAKNKDPSYEGQHNTLLLEEVTTLVKLEHDLVHNERLASIGRLAAGVAHEIGNPVTGIACLAQNLKYDSDQPEVTEAAKDILTQTQRITRIVQSLVNFSHAGTRHHLTSTEIINLYDCAEDAIHLLSLNHRNTTHIIHNHIDKTLILSGDTQRILQVFLNLLKNALDACHEKPNIMISSHSDEKSIRIMIEDNGSGIPPAMQNRIFEPFFTTKEPGEGTGLGLSVTYSIIEEHNGHIEVQSPVDAGTQTGTRFILHLPRNIELPDSEHS